MEGRSRLKTRPYDPEAVYYIVSDQPDCCGKCGSRLERIDTVMIEDETIYVTECLGCGKEVLLVDD